jgi:adenylosuccinate lyase
MQGVAAGGDRQELHELMRKHSHAATAQLKTGTGSNDLIARLRVDQAFKRINFDRLLDPKHLVGRAPEQVMEFIEQEVKPLRQQFVPSAKI